MLMTAKIKICIKQIIARRIYWKEGVFVCNKFSKNLKTLCGKKTKPKKFGSHGCKFTNALAPAYKMFTFKEVSKCNTYNALPSFNKQKKHLRKGLGTFKLQVRNYEVLESFALYGIRAVRAKQRN